MSEKKFKVGDAVVSSPLYRGAAVRHGIVAWVGRRWFTVSFGGRPPLSGERWDAFTGRKDSDYTACFTMLVEEYEAQRREAKASEALFDVGIRLERESKLTAVAVLAAIKPLLEGT